MLTGFGDQQAAERIARKDISDADALAELAVQVTRGERLRPVVERAARTRSDYVSDRAFRLLAALLDDTPVRPIDPDFAELFEEEARLGRMPLRDAFEHLATLEPGLRELPDNPPAPPPHMGLRGMLFGKKVEPDRYQELSHELLGLHARRELPILRSDISTSIVRQYVVAKDRNPDLLAEPYFTNPKARVISGEFLGPGRPDAAN